MLRLNVAIPPSASPHINGILGGDLAGFPNGRRVIDNIVAIELRAVAGATYPLVDSSSRPTPRPGRSSTSSTPSCRGTSATSTRSRTSTTR